MADLIQDVLSEGCVALDLQGRKKHELIAELVQLVVDSGLVNSAGDAHVTKHLVKEIVKRERMSSTGIGDGIAIPHILTERVDSTVMAFGRKREGAKFDSVDKQPVFLFFLLLGPKGAYTDHLKLLSKLSRLLHDPDLRRKLLAVNSQKEVVDLLTAREHSGRGSSG